MFLTAVLLRGRIPGRQWIRKHRWPRTLFLQAKENMICRLEAENHYWLSMSNMTAKYGHATERRAKAFEPSRQRPLPSSLSTDTLQTS